MCWNDRHILSNRICCEQSSILVPDSSEQAMRPQISGPKSCRHTQKGQVKQSSSAAAVCGAARHLSDTMCIMCQKELQSACAVVLESEHEKTQHQGESEWSSTRLCQWKS